jgi:hypothetical protein
MNKTWISSVLVVVAACSVQPPESTSRTAKETALSGAIFTTNSDGTVVDGNIYTTACSVYLNGGPAHTGAAGLPAGDYYFQVTDPSGKVLLSTDPITDRLVTIDASGRFISSTHPTSPNLVDGGVVVQLCPYNVTPNMGNEYKVWLTPVGDYSPGEGKHGFLNKFSKTDNFKVIPEVPPIDAGPPPPIDAAPPPPIDAAPPAPDAAPHHPDAAPPPPIDAAPPPPPDARVCDAPVPPPPPDACPPPKPDACPLSL